MMKLEQAGNVTSMWFDVKAGWEQWFLLRSDVHHDSVRCARELETQHLLEAKRRKAYILDAGDLFDAMQGRFDPRRSMDELREEYRRNDYYDFVVKDTAEYLSPYSKQIIMLGRGNHETAVLKNANTDLTDRLAYAINSAHKTDIKTGGYGGWVRFMFNLRDGKQPGVRTSIRMKYFHGAGADAPVTRGVIQTNRQAVYLPDATIVWNGHNHSNYVIPIARERLSEKGTLYSDIQWHIRTPGYKQDYGDGSKGWAVEKGQSPKPIGVVWMKLDYFSDSIRIKFEPDVAGPEMIDAGGYAGGARFEYSDDSEYP